MTQESEIVRKQMQAPGIIFNVKKMLLIMLRNWYFYFISIVISVGTGYYYLQIKIPTYRVAATVLIGGGESRQGPEELLQGFAIRPGLQNLDNQMLILRSYNMIRKTIDELNFEIDVYRKGFMSRVSFYPMSPLIIEPGADGLPHDIEFVFQYAYNNYYYISTAPNAEVFLDTLMSFGQLIKLDRGSFTISPQPGLEDIYTSGEKIFMRFLTKDRLTGRFMSRVNVQPVTREGGIVRITLQGTNRIKNMVFLNKLTEVFIEDNLEKKNIEANRIIEFISAQLVDVTDSLELTESQLQEFRSRNRIMDVSAQAGQIVEQALTLENENARLSLERNYYEYLETYLADEDNLDAPIVPASMGITDPVLATLIQELAGIQTEYYSSGAGARNPLQGQLEIRIRNTKQSIRETLSGIKLANQMALDENERQISRLNIEASRLPIKEQQLLGFERKFNLNNVLYTYLLQERAQAQIQRASNKSDHELVDVARLMGLISPDRRTVFMFALAIALAIPTLLLVLKDMFRNTINSEDDLTSISQLPVVAHLPSSRLKYNTVVLTEPNSRISEAFRSLRTRMDFFTSDDKCPLILVTSSIPGEGKTFSAINLASSYSLTGKKTLLIGFDLRRPLLLQSFDLEGIEGLSHYLIGKCDLEDVVYETDFENLFLLPSGVIPPNPGELASSQKAIAMFTRLKKDYDYIIVDSPPIGVVSDIYPVAAISNVVSLVVRHGYTKRNILSATISEVKASGIDHLNLILNDIKGSSYRHSYKYKYEYKNKKEKSKKKI